MSGAPVNARRPLGNRTPRDPRKPLTQSTVNILKKLSNGGGLMKRRSWQKGWGGEQRRRPDPNPQRFYWVLDPGPSRNIRSRERKVEKRTVQQLIADGYLRPGSESLDVITESALTDKTRTTLPLVDVEGRYLETEP